MATQRQQTEEDLYEIFRFLIMLSKDCKFKALTALQYNDESIRDAPISYFRSASIRKGQPYNKSLDINTVFERARSLKVAPKNSLPLSLLEW